MPEYAQGFKVVFAGGKILRVSDTFEGVVQNILTSQTLKVYEPLKIVYVGTGKVLYFNRDMFEAYYKNELPYEQLIRATLCDELYRNKHDMQSHTGDQVEAGSLWMLKNNQLILIDNDRYVTVGVDLQVFEIAE